MEFAKVSHGEKDELDLQTHRTYNKNECITFLKTAEQFGGLSYMAGGYPLLINGTRILTSEALYQACRFPHLPDVQRLIIGERSPISAKMKSKSYRKDSRTDWDIIRVQIMRWCLHVKLVQHWEKFGELLLSTGNKPIVEVSYKDQFWGAKPINEEALSGLNVLGRLLVELREKLQDPETHQLWIVKSPPLAQFLLLNKPIGSIELTWPLEKSVPHVVQKDLEVLVQPTTNSNESNDQVNTYANQDETSIPVTNTKLSEDNPFQPDVTIIQSVLPFEGLDSETLTQKPKSKPRSLPK
jgi:ribA/ribD-fused uncharacterized protein